MTNKELHINKVDFKRYIEDKMTDSERNAFEKELHKHPFEAEALEGIATLPPDKFLNDLNKLRLQILPAKRNNKFRLMAAAATVLLIISAGVIWMQIKTQNQPLQTAETKTTKPIKKSIERHELQKEQPATTEVKEEEKINKVPPKKKERPAKQALPPPPAKKKPENISSETLKIVDDDYEAETDNYILVENEVADEFAIQEDKLPSDKSAKLRNVLANKQTPTEMIIAAPAPEAAIAEQKIIIENVAAHPFNGFKKYEEYLDSTAVLPNHYKKRKVKVQIKFKADSAGNLSGFENINGADSILFKKACELVKNGPRWVPEIKDGKQVDSEVELRVVFRKK